MSGYSLITVEVGGDSCAVHSLVELWLTQGDQKESLAEQSVRLLAETFPNGEHENKQICECLRHEVRSEPSTTDRAIIQHNIGWFDWRQRRYASARASVEAAYKIRRRQMRDDREQSTLNCVSLLA